MHISSPSTNVPGGRRAKHAHGDTHHRRLANNVGAYGETREVGDGHWCIMWNPVERRRSHVVLLLLVGPETVRAELVTRILWIRELNAQLCQRKGASSTNLSAKLHPSFNPRRSKALRETNRNGNRTKMRVLNTIVWTRMLSKNYNLNFKKHLKNT